MCSIIEFVIFLQNEIVIILQDKSVTTCVHNAHLTESCQIPKLEQNLMRKKKSAICVNDSKVRNVCRFKNYMRQKHK